MRSLSKGSMLAISLTALIAACGMVESDDWMPVQTAQQIGGNPKLLEGLLTDATVWTHIDPGEGGHGSQIEYHSSDGRSFLWYPGNTAVVEGRWKVDFSRNGRVMLCYLYGANTYNPVTKVRGGDWECSLATENTARADAFLKGDPFRLATGRVPFVIKDRKVHDPRELYAQWGKNPAELDYITNVGEIN